jgi:hypothetical protein
MKWTAALVEVTQKTKKTETLLLIAIKTADEIAVAGFIKEREIFKLKTFI